MWLVEWMVQFLRRWVSSKLLLEDVIFIQASDNTLVTFVALVSHNSYPHGRLLGLKERFGAYMVLQTKLRAWMTPQTLNPKQTLNP